MSELNEVRLTVPGDPAHLPLARVVAVSCAALAGFGVDRIEDVRQCAQEAMALLLATGATGDIWLTYRVHTERLLVRAWQDSDQPVSSPEETSFAWLLLAELANSARMDVVDGHLVVRFVVESHKQPTG